MSLLSGLTALPLTIADDESAGWIADVEDKISSGFDPVAEAVGNVIFFEVSIGPATFPLIVFWLVLAAAVFTIYLKGIQLTGVRTALDLIRGKYSRESDPGEVTHFQAISSSLSGTVGLGNIAGVAVAVTLGGPGATFWLILAGLLGMCTKFVECTLGVRYREIHEDGTATGGPFRYMPVAFERLGPVLSKFAVSVFAIALIMFGALGGNAFQSNQTYAQAVEVTGGPEGPLGSDGASLIFGVVLAALVGAVILGGIKSIARVTSKLVPLMALLYLGSCLVVILSNLTSVPDAVGSIFSGAFDPDGITGGVIGVLIIGFQRAAFSNEAGVGSAPIVHAAVKTKNPVSEGFVASLGPFVDTVIVCTMTALTIIIAGPRTNYQDIIGEEISNDSGVVLTSRSFDTFIPGFGKVLAVAVALFAFSTLITWSYYTLKAWTTLVGRTPGRESAFKVIFLVFTVIGSVVNLGSVLDFADAMLFVCAIFNLSACYILLPKVKEELNRFRAGLRSGEIAEVPKEERAT